MGLKYDRRDNQWKFQEKCRGFDDEEPTREPLSIMDEDISEMLEAFLTSFPNQQKVLINLREWREA